MFLNSPHPMYFDCSPNQPDSPRDDYRGLSDGGWGFSHRSKVCTFPQLYTTILRQDGLGLLAQAIHLIMKYEDPDHEYDSPCPSLIPGGPPNPLTPKKLADFVWDKWFVEDIGITMFQVPFVGGNDNHASSLRTNQMLVLQTLLGYYYDQGETHRSRADTISDILRQVQVGHPPQPANGIKSASGIEFIRPTFAGSQLFGWSIVGSLGVAGFSFVRDLINKYFGLPFDDLDLILSTVEATATYAQAFRVYLYHKHGITLGIPNTIPGAPIPPNDYLEGDLAMTTPILTKDGFVGQRWIIDDYFQAGETLHAGDVVGIKEQSASPHLPRVFKIDIGVDVPRVIGVVHTPADKDVGDQVATQDDFVSVVVQGVAQVLSARAIGVGDPVTPSGNSGFAPGKINQVARAGIATTDNDAFIGRCVKGTSGANEVAEILVDISGGHDSAVSPEPQRSGFPAPTNLEVVTTVIGGQLSVVWDTPPGFERNRDYYQIQYREAGANALWYPTAPIQWSNPNYTIASLLAVAYEVQVQAVYFDPEGFDEGVSAWVEATGTPANNLPVANAGLDRMADFGVTVTLQGSGTDLDGDMLTYLWEQIDTGAPMVTLSSSTVARPTFPAPVTPTTLKFQLTVTDTHQGIGTDIVTITVEGVSSLSTNATLSGLALTPSTLSLVLAFDSATISYAVSADNAVTSIRVTPTVNQANATVTVNGAAVTSGQESQQISLSVGETAITVVVTAQDGTTTKTYNLTVTRAALVNQAPTADAGAPQTVNRGDGYPRRFREQRSGERNIDLFLDEKSRPQRNPEQRYLRERQLHRPFNPDLIDLPGHGYGFPGERGHR